MITAEQNTLEYYQQLLSEASRGTGDIVRIWIKTPYRPRTDEYVVYRGSPLRGLIIGTNTQTVDGRATRVLFRRWPLITLCKERITLCNDRVAMLERRVSMWSQVAR